MIYRIPVSAMREHGDTPSSLVNEWIKSGVKFTFDDESIYTEDTYFVTFPDNFILPDWVESYTFIEYGKSMSTPDTEDEWV